MSLKTLRLPPRIKVLEATGAIADKRIRSINEKLYEVTSSDGTRKYKVYVDLDKNIVYSNDNGTRLRGYVGYPIIAVLMLNNKLPFNEKISKALAGIPWKKLNEKYKKYYIVEKIVKNIASKKGVTSLEIDRYINEVLGKLKSMKLYYDENLGETINP